MITTGHLTTGTFDIPLQPDTPGNVLDNIDIRNDPGKGARAYSRILITPQHFDPAATPITAIEEQALYAGILTGHGPNRHTLTGYGLPWLLGEDDGGALHAAATATPSAATIATHIANRVVQNPDNGIKAGAITTDATTFQYKIEPGTTRRQILASICARRSLEWRIRPNCRLDVNTAANLFASGQTILIDEGGRDGGINGVTADLALEGIDVDNVVSRQFIDWNNDGATLGDASNTLPADWDAPDGDGIVWRNYQTASSKGKLRDRNDVDKVTAWLNQNQTAANVTAAKMAADKASYRLEVTAEIDEHNPTRFIKPGDTVYVFDQRLGLYDTATQLTYRGRTVFPVSLRVQDMTIPCRAEYGYYLLTGGGTLVDITRYVEPEDRQCAITLGTRRSYTKAKPRKRKIDKVKNRNRARLMVYLNRAGR